MSGMRFPRPLIRAALLMVIPAALFPAAAQTTQSVFTGGDAGEGLDLQGDVAFAWHLGGDPVIYQAGDALFKPDSSLTLTGADEVINEWAAADFGPSDNDQSLGLPALLRRSLTPPTCISASGFPRITHPVSSARDRARRCA